jgi:hypothetical protein
MLTKMTAARNPAVVFFGARRNRGVRRASPFYPSVGDEVAATALTGLPAGILESPGRHPETPVWVETLRSERFGMVMMAWWHTLRSPSPPRAAST